MMAKTMLKMLVASVLVAAMAVTASAAFTKKNTYGNQFADVKDSSWYAKEVASAYELGFVEGVSETEYSPNTTVTVAQGITMAARVHAEYNGKTIAKVDGKWYDMYVKYAKDNKIISEYQFDDYTREIKRFEMAELFHDAMGKDYYNAINDVVFVPDLPIGAMYNDKILTLYNAGVVTGNDEFGTFAPDSNIKRSECAAIINRVALPENRKSVKLSKFSSKDAYTLVYNSGMSSTKEGINSGWVLDNRGGSARVSNTGFGAVGDVSEKYAAAYVREFNYIDAGRFVMELNLTSKDNGAFIEFRDVNEKTVYMLKVVDGKWSIYDGTSYKALADAKGKTLFRVVVDLDKGVSETFIDGTSFGEAKLLSNNLLSLRAGIDEKGTGSLSIGEINIVANYGMYENFNLFGIDPVYGWEASEGVSISNEEVMFGSNGGSLKNTFSPISGTVIAENYFIMRAGKDFSVNVGDVLTVEAKEKKLVVGGQELYNLTQNMWYRLRVEADTNAGTAKIWLNGRVIGTANLAKKEAVSYFAVNSTGLMGIDNVKVYEKIKHADYVPAPTTRASLDDYIVAMNICSLWRNGTHYGWSCITPYDDRKPVIGYYDEGVVETADWEIKYMVEHGIDVQSFCWFGDASSGPLKTPSWGEQLHEAFMYAEYSDYMYYVLQWETSATQAFNSGQFRNYVIPFWFENYFLDSRYLKVDNKLVLSIYNAENLATNKYFGSHAKAKAELDYLEKKAKEYGFDGVIYVASGTPSSAMENMGIDGTYAYSWGEDGRKLDVNKSRNTGAAKSSKTVHAIPTLSVGFDSVPWHHLRYGLISYADYEAALSWTKNEHLPSIKAQTPDWAEKFVWLSTWNEFGEGTIIFPAGQQEGNDFGYVDAVRNTLTNLPKAHVDVVPTARQKDRVTHLYPQYATLLRREGWYKHDANLETSKNEPKNKLFVNDVDVLGNAEEEFHIPPVVKNGKVYFPFNPSTSVNFILNTYFEWREDVGTLKIDANGHSVKFQVGSDLYLKDGVLTNLGYVVETLDDIPLLDFVKLAKDLGYKVEEKEGNVYIFTDTYEDLWKNIGERKTGVWDFNLYDSEGWDSTHFELSVGGGSMTMVTNGNNPGDPSATNSELGEDFFAKRFTDLEIRAAYNFDAPYAHSITLYYITDKDTVWNEEKSIKFQMQETDTQGEYKVYKTSLKDHVAWQNAELITGLRLDPFNCQGTFIVDYIRFIEDPDFVYTPPEKKEFAIENGDAETPNQIAFYSSNTKISIIEEPENKKNHVYYVESNPGNTYAYFRHAAEFEPGATYHIEFDIKLVGNNVDDPKHDNSTFCSNLRYQDKTASGGIEHIIRHGAGTSVRPEISMKDGWVHYVGSHTIANIESNKGAEFTIYVNPKDGVGYDFYLDNIVCRKLSDTEKAKADPAAVFTWDWKDGKRYSFDKAEDLKAFTFSGASGKLEDGKLVMTADKGDPQAQLSGLKIDANKAVAVAVRYKAEEIDFTKNYLEIFFATDKEGELSQDKSSHVYFDSYKDEGDGYYTVVVNMGLCEKWKGTITTVRIDPANAVGTYYIDEVMIMEVVE